MMRFLLVAALGAGCGGGSGSSPPGHETESGTGATGDTGGTISGSVDSSSGVDGSTGDDPTETTGGEDVSCGDLGGIESPLAPLPEFAWVHGQVRGTGVSLSFEPVDGARDYRVYTLPSANAVVDDGQGQHIDGAIYRCAGDRMAPPLPYTQNGFLTVDARSTGDISGYVRSEEEITLGWVFATEAPDRVPVYQLGSPESGHDGFCYAGHYAVTRVPFFTADPAQREAWLAEGYRDDGIAFWVSEAGTRPVRRGSGHLFYASDAEVAARGEGEVLFDVLDAEQDGAVPLMRFTIFPCGGAMHDVLAAGEARFQRAFEQGNQPVWELEWPDLEPGEVLVVEALDAGCPFQGHLSARSVPATGFAQDFVTPEEAAAQSPYGELFVNGQHDPASDPQPIARSFVCPEPVANESMDVFLDFDEPFELEQTDLSDSGFWDLHLANDDFFASFYRIEPDVWGLGSVMGELWVTYADWGADVNGRFRLTSTQHASIGEGFVHATVEVDLWSTGRRYPQLWISSAEAPVQDNMISATTLNLQMFGGWPSRVEIQQCIDRFWDVNDQCPQFPLDRGEFDDGPWPPRPPVGELSAPGMRMRMDLYASADRAYAFVGGIPWGCVDYPNLLPAGDVTVTYGDVLYHSGVDESVVFSDYMPFIHDYQLTESRRHVDNFGFSSGVDAPEWNHDILPCVTALE